MVNASVCKTDIRGFNSHPGLKQNNTATRNDFMLYFRTLTYQIENAGVAKW